MKSPILIVTALTLTASASPPTGPRREEVIRDWYCQRCVSEYRRQAQECFEFWSDNPEMQLRCLTGPREEFWSCMALCGHYPAIYGEIVGLYEEGLIDSWDVVTLIEGIQ